MGGGSEDCYCAVLSSALWAWWQELTRSCGQAADQSLTFATLHADLRLPQPDGATSNWLVDSAVPDGAVSGLTQPTSGFLYPAERSGQQVERVELKPAWLPRT